MWTPGKATSQDWVDSTAQLPIAFAQVREDPRIDQQLVEVLGREARVLMVASGGETAALLSTMPIASLHLVDMNASQLLLTRLKLSMLNDTTTEQRLELLGHRPMAATERHGKLQSRLDSIGASLSDLGPADIVAELGPDFCGRYEWVFARLRQLLAPQHAGLNELLALSDPQKQADQISVGSELGSAIHDALAIVMELAKLVAIFGPGATANRARPFADHFWLRTKIALTTLPAATNPFLHQIFLGQFPGPAWDWMGLPQQATLCASEFHHGAMETIIPTLSDQSFDLIHLSNILDWIKPAEARSLLADAYRCLSPGGLVVIRQLNSTLDIPAVPSGFAWDRDLSQQMHAEDRSFFYRDLHVGKRE